MAREAQHLSPEQIKAEQASSDLLAVIEQGWDISKVDSNIITLDHLEAALLYNKVAAAKNILSRNIEGINANSEFADGIRPLHIAARFAMTQMVTTLLEQGADPAARTKDGKSALDIINDHPGQLPESEERGLHRRISTIDRRLDQFALNGANPQSCRMVEIIIRGALQKLGQQVPDELRFKPVGMSRAI